MYVFHKFYITQNYTCADAKGSDTIIPSGKDAKDFIPYRLLLDQ